MQHLVLGSVRLVLESIVVTTARGQHGTDVRGSIECRVTGFQLF
jgi:hypothetical protein